MEERGREGGRERSWKAQIQQPCLIKAHTQCTFLYMCSVYNKQKGWPSQCVGVHSPRATSRWSRAVLANTFQQSWLSRALAKDHASENLLSAMHLSKEVRICMMIRSHSTDYSVVDRSEHAYRLHINQVLMSVEEWYVCTSYPITTAIAIRSPVLVQWYYSLRTCFATIQLPTPPTPHLRTHHPFTHLLLLKVLVILVGMRC